MITVLKSREAQLALKGINLKRRKVESQRKRVDNHAGISLAQRRVAPSSLLRIRIEEKKRKKRAEVILWLELSCCGLTSLYQSWPKL